MTATQTNYREKLAACFGGSEVQKVTQYGWDGVDITRIGKILRIVPMYGKWSSGAEAYVMTADGDTVAGLKTSHLPPRLLADIAVLFASGYGMFV